MCFEPILAHTAVGDKGHGEVNGVLHFRNDNLAYALHFVGRYVEIEFIVYLHDHLRAEMLVLQAAIDSHHRHLDNIGSGAQDRRIDGIAFGKRADGGVLRIDVRQVTFASEERLGIAAVARYLLLVLDIADDTREGSKIVVDKLFGLGARTIELLCKAESGDAVDNTEIGRLGTAALVFRDLVSRQTEYT